MGNSEPTTGWTNKREAGWMDDPTSTLHQIANLYAQETTCGALTRPAESDSERFLARRSLLLRWTPFGVARACGQDCLLRCEQDCRCGRLRSLGPRAAHGEVSPSAPNWTLVSATAVVNMRWPRRGQVQAQHRCLHPALSPEVCPPRCT